MANKSMREIPVAIGLMVSYLSAVSLLGVSSENYVYGTQYAVINISYGLATPIAAYFYLPVFFKIGTASAFEVNSVNTIMQNSRLVLLKIICINYNYLIIFKARESSDFKSVYNEKNLMFLILFASKNQKLKAIKNIK